MGAADEWLARQLAVTEAELVEACVEMRESRGTVDAMVEAFDGAIIYCERPERLGLMLRTVPGLGTWTAAFSDDVPRSGVTRVLWIW